MPPIRPSEKGLIEIRRALQRIEMAAAATGPTTPTEPPPPAIPPNTGMVNFFSAVIDINEPDFGSGPQFYTFEDDIMTIPADSTYMILDCHFAVLSHGSSPLVDPYGDGHFANWELSASLPSFPETWWPAYEDSVSLVPDYYRWEWVGSPVHTPPSASSYTVWPLTSQGWNHMNDDTHAFIPITTGPDGDTLQWKFHVYNGTPDFGLCVKGLLWGRYLYSPEPTTWYEICPSAA